MGYGNIIKRLAVTRAFKPFIFPLLLSKFQKDLTFITNHFEKYFQPLVSTDEFLRKEAYKIRHKVWCEELRYYKENKSRMEIDENDKNAIFGLIQHRPSKNFTGCVRMVIPKTQGDLMPIEHFSHHITKKSNRPDFFPRETVCEISRLAIPKDFRRRKEDNYEGAATGLIRESALSMNDLRSFPFISLGLAYIAAAMVLYSGRRHSYILVEPRLARSFHFLGLPFEQISPPFDYYGVRAIYHHDFTQACIQKNFKPRMAFLFGYIYSQISQALDNESKQEMALLIKNSRQ